MIEQCPDGTWRVLDSDWFHVLSDKFETEAEAISWFEQLMDKRKLN